MTGALGSRALIGSVFLIGASWTSQIIGIISTFVLARMLTPADYGIVAVAMLYMKFLELFAETGINQYILSRRTLGRGDLDSAWSLQLVSRLILAIVVVTTAPMAAAFFEQPAIISVLHVTAGIAVMQGVASPGILKLNREMLYGSVSLLTITAKIIAFLFALLVAWTTRSYWALVIGSLIYTSIFSAGSYIIARHRPHFSRANWNAQWSFTKWVYLGGLFGFSRSKADIFIVGKMFDVPLIGIYTMAKEIGMLPEAQVSRPLGSLFISSINENKDNPDAVTATFHKLFVALALVLLPATVGMHVLAPQLVSVLLGEQWLEAVPLLAALAWLSCTFAFSDAACRTLMALEQVKHLLWLNIGSFIVTVFLLFLAMSRTLEVFAYVRVLSGVLVTVASIALLANHIRLAIGALGVALLPSLTGIILMTLVLKLLEKMVMVLLPPTAALTLLVVVGAASYTIVTLAFSLLIESRSPSIASLLSLARSTISRVAYYIPFRHRSVRKL